MSIYKHILVATDFGDECEKVAKKAISLANGDAKVSLIHVLEPLDSIYGGEAYGATAIQLQQIQDEINKNTEGHLKAFGEKMGVPEDNQHLMSAITPRKFVILRKKMHVTLLLSAAMADTASGYSWVQPPTPSSTALNAMY